jgi:molecular chaperone DnaK
MAADNKSLGHFNLEGIPPAPRGMPQIEVTFDVDANGILNVKAKDKASGKEQSIRIEASSGLTPDDIERMKKDAELHAKEDEEKKALADVKNTADMTIFTAEKSLQDHGASLPEELKASVNTKIAELKIAKEGTDKAAIEAKIHELSAEMQKIGELMNASSNSASSDGNGPAENAATDETVKDAPAEEAPTEPAA